MNEKDTALAYLGRDPVLFANLMEVLRRGSARPAPVYRQDGLVFDFAAPAFWRAGEPLTLSPTEQRLLRLLVENRGCTLPRSLLLERVWGSEFVEENALSVTVRRLREKLEADASRPQYLRTVYGVGYRWQEAEP